MVRKRLPIPPDGVQQAIVRHAGVGFLSPIGAAMLEVVQAAIDPSSRLVNLGLELGVR